MSSVGIESGGATSLTPSVLSPEAGSMEEKIIATVAQWMRTPLDLPEEFRGWLPRYLETTDILLHPDQMYGAPAAAVPIGAYFPYAGTTAPTSYLFCDGTAVSRSTYAALYSFIGTSWGAGDGSTTFNIPNIKGRVPVHKDASQVEFDTVGETGGAKTVTLTTTEMPAHAHTGSSLSIATDNATHSHSWPASMFGNAGGFLINDMGSGYNFGNLYSGSNSASPAHSHPGSSITIASQGSGGAHANLPPYIVTNYIIRAL